MAICVGLTNWRLQGAVLAATHLLLPVSILLIVYSAFSAGMVQGIWHIMSPAELFGLVFLCAALLAMGLGRGPTERRDVGVEPS